MRAGSLRAALAALALLPQLAFAATRTHTFAVHVPDRMRRLLIATLIADDGPPPQAVQSDPQGITVDPSHLDQPGQLERRLRVALRKPYSNTRLAVNGGFARLGRYSVGSDQTVHSHIVVLEGDAEIHGHVVGNVVTLDGDVTVYPGASVAGDVLAIGGRIHRIGSGTISGVQRTLAATAVGSDLDGSIGTLVLLRLAGIAGITATLLLLGAGLVTFGRPNLEIVSDTVTHSIARSFVVGLLGQALVLPTLGMLIVGLVLTIAGTVLLPFVIAVFSLIVLIVAVLGLLAVAHAMGERITRRRMARGRTLSPNSYRYVSTGLGCGAAVWISWGLFGWVPVAGVAMGAAALVTTWTLASIGFGAALLSRGGIREHFAGRLIAPEMMTDEYLWATPQFGVPAIKRPPSNQSNDSKR